MLAHITRVRLHTAMRYSHMTYQVGLRGVRYGAYCARVGLRLVVIAQVGLQSLLVLKCFATLVTRVHM